MMWHSDLLHFILVKIQNCQYWYLLKTLCGNSLQGPPKFVTFSLIELYPDCSPDEKQQKNKLSKRQVYVAPLHALHNRNTATSKITFGSKEGNVRIIGEMAKCLRWIVFFSFVQSQISKVCTICYSKAPSFGVRRDTLQCRLCHKQE